MYYLPKTDINNMNQKKLLILTLIIISLPLLSLPSLYFIVIFILINCYNIFKKKLSCKPLLMLIMPLVFVCVLFYFYNLIPVKLMQLSSYSTLWTKVFSTSLITNIAVVIRFLFLPNLYTLPVVILICSYVVYAVFNKKEHNIFNFYCICVMLLSIVCSWINIYPLEIGRTALFLLPVAIILSLKLIDILSIKNCGFYLSCILLIAGYYKYYLLFNHDYINMILSYDHSFSPRILMSEMKNKYNDKTDIIITNEASKSSYFFYSNKYSFNPNLDEKTSFKFRETRDELFSDLNALNPNQNYWFYLIKEFTATPQRIYYIEWLESQDVLYYKKDKNSYLYYIKGIRKQ